MKQLHLFYLMLLALCSVNSYAQTVTIGTGTSTTDNAPIQRSADYSSSEILYLSSEIGVSGAISQLAFYKGSGTAAIDSVYIYLKKTTDTALAVTGSTTGYTLVYQGPISTATGWKTLTFNMVSSFQYSIYEGNLGVLVVRPYAAAITTNRPFWRYTANPAGGPDSLCAFYRGANAWADTTIRTISVWRPNIQFTITPSCPAPTAATATNLTAFTADLNWSYSGNPMTYEIKYGPQGFNVNTAGTSVYTATKPYTLNPPLTPSTSYSYYVRAICAAGDTSAWTAVTNFATPATCVAPTTPTSTGITKNSAILNWTNTGSPINFEIKYGAQGFNVNTGGTSVFTTAKPYTLNPPLTPATGYSYYVRSICTPGDTSAWSPVNNFITLCDYPSVLSSTNGTACSGSTAILQAIAEAGGTIKWYNTATSGTLLSSGNNYTTPVLTVSDTFYAESSALASAGSLGRSTPTTFSATTPGSGGGGYRFSALKDVIIDSVSVWAAGDTGTITIQLQTSTGAVLQTAAVYRSGMGGSSATPAKAYIPLNFNVATGTNYRLVAIAGTIGYVREQSGVSGYPFTIPNVYTINANMINGATNTNQCYFIYDTYLSTGCINPIRQPVIATVVANPLTALPDTAGTCNGAAATLNSGSASTTWTPTSNLYTNAAATNAYTGGAIQTVYAKATLPQKVYATTTSGSCTFNDSVYIDVQTGTAVDVTPNNPSMACGDATAVALASNTPVNWTTAGGNLYTDAAGSTPYVAGTATTGVLAKAVNNRYVKGAYTIGGCVFADSALIIVNNPSANALSNNTGAVNTDSTIINGTAANIHNNDCELMASVSPTGGSPVNGWITGRIIMDGAVQNTAAGPYVTRHFELTPKTNAATSNATITLYFTQPEFDAYNTYVTTNGNVAVNPLLPATPAGSTANILVDKFNAASGSPSPTNNNSAIAITPTSVIWDAANNWWAVTFPTTGFSGFFLHTNVNPTPLPVNWISTSATLNHQKQAVINWSVSEKETVAYQIQKSTDGSNFAKLATVNSKGNGNNAYSYTEGNILSGKAWYRIVQQGKDGKESYSRIMELQNSVLFGTISIYPNPATQVLTVETEAGAMYSIYDLQGKRVMKGNLQPGKNALNVSALARGFYTIKIGDYNQKIVLQ